MELEVSYLSPEEITQALQTQKLELIYERALRQAERIYEEERVRALRVQLLLLEDENDDFQDQIAEREVELGQVDECNEDLQQQLIDMQESLQHSQLNLKARLREVENYKMEVSALNATSADTSKILSEKLSVTRELTIVKTELDHLRSQTSTQQNLLAEKLALQRELGAIQVELDTEKRTVQRIKAHDKSTTNDESILSLEIEELKKDVAKANREAQKTEREHRKKAIEWDGQKEILEGKLEAFRNKLRTTKEQLKEAQEDLEKAQAAKMTQSAEMTKARLTGANPKKRPVARFDPDMTIGTPGHGGPAAKKIRTSVNVGDKSTFSITPFLNRTLSILPETPSEEDKDANENAEENLNEHIHPVALEPAKRATKLSPTKKADSIQNPLINTTAKSKSAQPLKETTNPRANSVIKKPSLAKVTEEAINADEDVGPLDNLENTEPTKSVADLTMNPVEKKQKVLNKRSNIFDEEDDKKSKQIGNIKARPLTASGLRGGGLTASSLGKISLASLGKGGKGKTLAEFSPLKKDRRAAVGGDSVVAAGS